jgi:hypothetical protein
MGIGRAQGFRAAVEPVSRGLNHQGPAPLNRSLKGSTKRRCTSRTPTNSASGLEKSGRFPISGGSIDATGEAGNREASHFSEGLGGSAGTLSVISTGSFSR